MLIKLNIYKKELRGLGKTNCLFKAVIGHDQAKTVNNPRASARPGIQAITSFTREHQKQKTRTMTKTRIITRPITYDI